MKLEYEDIIKKLKQNDPSLTKLKLSQKNLTPEVSQAILEALKENTVVTDLYYLDNNSSGHTAKVLGSMLEVNRSIEQLYLGTNALNNDDLKHIIRGMMDNPSITMLDINSNLFDDPQPICDLLEHNNSLQEIDLTNSQLSNENFQKIFDVFKENDNSSLTAFNVYYAAPPCINDFNDRCAENASRHSTLKLN